jgi:hypothetical protein
VGIASMLKDASMGNAAMKVALEHETVSISDG